MKFIYIHRFAKKIETNKKTELKLIKLGFLFLLKKEMG